MFANKKWLSALIWIATIAGLYFAYDGWKSYRYQQSQQAERLALEAMAARKAELRRQKNELSERLKTRLEATRVLRSGTLKIVLFNSDSEQPDQTLNFPFVLEIGQELELPVIHHEGKRVRLKADLEAPEGVIKPLIMLKNSDGIEPGKSGWEELADDHLPGDQSQLKLSLRPAAYRWGESVELSMVENTRTSDSPLKLFLLAPSRARRVLSPDKDGRFRITPTESGLWRYLWYVENKDQLAQSQPLNEGVFFVIYPDSRERLDIAVKPLYHRLSKVRDELNDYLTNQLVRELAKYGRLGVEESAYVDEQLKLIRSKKPQAAIKEEPGA